MQAAIREAGRRRTDSTVSAIGPERRTAGVRLYHQKNRRRLAPRPLDAPSPFPLITGGARNGYAAAPRGDGGKAMAWRYPGLLVLILATASPAAARADAPAVP